MYYLISPRGNNRSIIFVECAYTPTSQDNSDFDTILVKRMTRTEEKDRTVLFTQRVKRRKKRRLQN